MIRPMATEDDMWNNDSWVMISTPVERGRSCPTAKRSDLRLLRQLPTLVVGAASAPRARLDRAAG